MSRRALLVRLVTLPDRPGTRVYNGGGCVVVPLPYHLHAVVFLQPRTDANLSSRDLLAATSTSGFVWKRLAEVYSASQSDVSLHCKYGTLWFGLAALGMRGNQDETKTSLDVSLRHPPLRPPRRGSTRVMGGNDWLSESSPAGSNRCRKVYLSSLTVDTRGSVTVRSSLPHWAAVQTRELPRRACGALWFRWARPQSAERRAYGEVRPTAVQSCTTRRRVDFLGWARLTSCSEGARIMSKYHKPLPRALTR
ncbi:uncharacterized protein B0H18DRAFT_1101196 [Fomitopsis serialis]|uniref:uncharacterized protein n=1 Tax=Fomitopsis serialis TaxID=139415 RepID=UPI00200776D3|nr:uncharacterized protein B0H18DRAFT_1101196 [Neoantrodia serialis]KAH9935395.1 hypothetical protein B0H18DRAFT_1101196 [Neoantrodia serialis]